MTDGKYIERGRLQSAESLGALSIALWSVALINYLSSGISWANIILFVIGAISALVGLYLLSSWNWKKKDTLEFLEKYQIITTVKLVGWLCVLAAFGVGLYQTKKVWLIIVGDIFIILGYVVLFLGIHQMAKNKNTAK